MNAEERADEETQAGDDPPASGTSIDTGDVTRLLHRWSRGDPDALEHLVPLVYQELRRLAQSHLRNEREGHTLRRTALVHEAFLRLVQQRQVQLESRAQFFAWASHVMRRILINHARNRRAEKRGGGAPVESLDLLQEQHGELAMGADHQRDDELIALDDALQRLERLDARRAQVVELRFFGGLGVDEAAQSLGVSPASVVRDWSAARAWLLHQLQQA